MSNVMEAERGLFSVTPKGKTRVTGRKILLTLTTTKDGRCEHGQSVVWERDCQEQLRGRRLKVGRLERPTLALWGCREGRAHSTKGSQAHLKISGQSRPLPASPPQSFTEYFPALGRPRQMQTVPLRSTTMKHLNWGYTLEDVRRWDFMPTPGEGGGSLPGRRGISVETCGMGRMRQVKRAGKVLQAKGTACVKALSGAGAGGP